MRPDIVELVEYATKLGLRSVFGTMVRLSQKKWL